jgi:hypothetical protein
VKPAARGAYHLVLAPGGDFGGIGAGPGVDQRQFGDTFGRLPHDLEGDVTAHRMAGERKARRRLGQDPPGNRSDIVVADVVGDRHRPQPPQGRHHGAENPWRGSQARNEQDRHRIVHAGLRVGVFFEKITLARGTD